MSVEPSYVLFVCTANICRSASAELVAAERYDPERFVFRSAGFLEAGRSVPDKLVKVLGERGLDATAHRSHVVDSATLAAADLVLTMEGRHLQEAAVIEPSSLAKTMPLKEAASLARPGDSVDSLLERLNTDRDPMRYLSQRFDVDDPYGRSTRTYRAAVDEIALLVQQVFDRLEG